MLNNFLRSILILVLTIKMRTDILEVNGVKYLIKIFYEDRQNSSVSIGKKSVNIRIPLSLNREEQFRSTLKMKHWAREQLEKNPPKKEKAKEYSNGELLKVGNAEYKLSISFAAKQSSSARLHNNTENFE